MPLFVRWPGRIDPAQTIRELAAHVDRLPTLADLAGVPLPEGPPLDGVSLAPALLGEAPAPTGRTLYTHPSAGARLQPYPGAVRTDRWRLVREWDDWLTGFTRAGDRATWLLDVVAEGDYRVVAEYAAPAAGARLRAFVRNASPSDAAAATVPRVHDPSPLPSPDRVPRGEVYAKAWARLELGTLRLSRGRQALVLEMAEASAQHLDLKGLYLYRQP